MKWYRPIETARLEIKEPIQRIAIISIAAIAIAMLALFIALGKD